MFTSPVRLQLMGPNGVCGLVAAVFGDGKSEEAPLEKLLPVAQCLAQPRQCLLPRYAGAKPEQYTQQAGAYTFIYYVCLSK